MQNIWNSILEFLKNEGWSILLAISAIIIALVVIKIICLILSKILIKSKVDGSAVAFYIALTKLVLWIVTIFVVAGLLNVSTSSLVVGLSSVLLAVALALKDSLANLANGILIIYNKPFRRGDRIKIEDAEGIIYNIKLLTSEIITADNKKLIVPNSKMINGTIVNYTSLPTRRIDYNFTVSYNSDLDKVERVVKEVLVNDKRINKTPEPVVQLSGHLDSALQYVIKIWVDTNNYWDVYNSLSRILYDTLTKNNISIPFNQLDVHIIEKGDSHE